MCAHVMPGGVLARLNDTVSVARRIQDGSRTFVFVDGVEVPPGTHASGRSASIFRTNDKTLEEVLSRVDVACL